MKKPLQIALHLLALLILVLGITTYFIIDGLTNTKIYEDVSWDTEQFELPDHPYSLDRAIEENKAFSLEYPENGEFTILWATDFHLRRGPFADRDKLYALLEKAFEETNPNLTVITGDLLFSFNGLLLLQEFASFMEEQDQYWAYCFGNHDGQYRYDREALGNLLMEYPHALFSRGESWVRGESDYIISLDHEGVPVQALVFLDSHDHRIYEDGDGPDYIYPSQIAWYRWMTQGLQGVPLYTFFHIPLPEYRLMWESGVGTGVQNDKKINVPWENTGLFSTMVEDGSTVATFSGHDHLNDFTGFWEGISLNAGRSASYGSYGSNDHPKGVTTITLQRDNPRFFARQTYTVDDWNL